jgi:hypothetical protein
MTQTQHYAVGDQVHVAIGSLSGPATTGTFEIMVGIAWKAANPCTDS